MNNYVRASENSKFFKCFNFLFNKTSLLISMLLLDFLVNVILSELYSKKNFEGRNEAPWNNARYYYKYNNTCCTRCENEDVSRFDVIIWESILTKNSLTCFKHWITLFCTGSPASTRSCFPISIKSNLNLNYSLALLPSLNSETQKAIQSSLLQQVKVCLDTNQVIVQDTSGCSLQCIKDHVFRIFPIVTHTMSVVVLVRTPDLRFSYGNSILYYVICLLMKSVFNVVVVAKVLVSYGYVCISIAVALQLSWLLSEAWQVVISYQIWKGFKPGLVNARSLRTCPILGDGIYYYPIAWTLPFVVVVLALCMDLIPGVPDSLSPEFGVCRCWFIDERTRMIYASVPAALAEVVALGMFLVTLYHLKSARALSTSLQTLDSRRHCSRENHWVMIYIKVSFLTGASYVLVTLFGLCTLNYKDPQGVPPYIINTIKDIERFRGFEIFYIFVLNKKNFLHSSTSSSNEQSARNVEEIPTVDFRVSSRK